MKRHRQVGPDADLQDTPAVGAEPARDVHRNDPEGPSLAWHVANASVCGEASPAYQRIAERWPERSTQPRSEEGIDQQVRKRPGPGDGFGLACPRVGIGPGKPAPFLEIRICILGQLPGIAQKRGLDLPTPFPQQPCHDKPVAAVVSRAAKHACAMRRAGEIRPSLEDGIHHAPASPLHEFKPRDFAARHGSLLNGTHFCGGQNGGHDRTARNVGFVVPGRSSSGIAPLR